MKDRDKLQPPLDLSTGTHFNARAAWLIVIKFWTFSLHTEILHVFLYVSLTEEPERKRPLGRLRCTWGDDIRMDLRGIG
jgi:hypothetical protein